MKTPNHQHFQRLPHAELHLMNAIAIVRYFSFLTTIKLTVCIKSLQAFNWRTFLKIIHSNIKMSEEKKEVEEFQKLWDKGEIK